jgi:hypothetical protein
MDGLPTMTQNEKYIAKKEEIDKKKIDMIFSIEVT